jgi:hypothetical protein
VATHARRSSAELSDGFVGQQRRRSQVARQDDLTEFFENSGPYPKDIEEQMQRDWDEAVEENGRYEKKQSAERESR